MDKKIGTEEEWEKRIHELKEKNLKRREKNELKIFIEKKMRTK